MPSYHRKPLVLLAFLAAFILGGAVTQAAQLSQGEKDTIFVGRLHVQPAVTGQAEHQGRSRELKSVVEALETELDSALSATRVFQMVERKRKGDVELEQAYAQGGGVDISDKSAAQVGKMAGAKFVFLPEINGFEDGTETRQYQTIGRTSMTRKLFLSATVKIVDTTTGKYLPDAPSIKLEKDETVEMARTGAGSANVKGLVNLAAEMASKLSREVVALLRPAKVLSITGKQIQINRGIDAGFNRGDLVEVYAVQDVKDEDTGEIFRNEVPVGQATVERCDKKQSFARITGDDMGIAKGCVVRVVSAASARVEGASGVAAGEAETPAGSGEKPLKW